MRREDVEAPVVHVREELGRLRERMLSRRALHGDAPRLGLAGPQAVAERRERDLQLPVVPRHEDGLRLLEELVVAHGRQRDAEAAAVLLRDRPLDQRRVRSRAQNAALDDLAGAGDVEVQRLAPESRRHVEARDAAHLHGGRLGEEDERQRGGRVRARDEEVLRHLVRRPEVVDRRVAQAVGARGQRGQLELRLALRVVRHGAGRRLRAVLPRAQPLVDGVVGRPARAEQVAGGLEFLAPSRSVRSVLRGARLARRIARFRIA